MAEEDHQVLDADFDGLDEGVEHAGGEGEGVDVSANNVAAAVG
jgi:hypothetical protein